MHDDEGQVTGAVAAMLDVSDRVETERELHQLNETLEERVEERTAELQDKTRRLRHLAAELSSAEQRERRHLAGLYETGLAPALQGLASETFKRHRLAVSFDAEEARLTLRTEAEAPGETGSSVAISSPGAADTSCLHLVVEDEGCGFDVEAAFRTSGADQGFGLFSIRERLSALGGSTTVDAAPGEGTYHDRRTAYRRR